MKKFNIGVEAMISKMISVEAESEEAALEAVKQMLSNQQFIINNDDIYSIQTECVSALEITSAIKLPDGWEWHMYNDGSGGLYFDGNCYFSFDLATEEYMFNYKKNAGWELFRGIPFEDIQSMAENYIINSVMNPKTYFEKYPTADPIVSDNKKYVFIEQMLEEDGRSVVFTVLYRPDEDSFMYVDTAEDCYWKFDDFSLVKQFMSDDAITKFENFTNEILKNNNEKQIEYAELER